MAHQLSNWLLISVHISDLWSYSCSSSSNLLFEFNVSQSMCRTPICSISDNPTRKICDHQIWWFQRQETFGIILHSSVLFSTACIMVKKKSFTPEWLCGLFILCTCGAFVGSNISGAHFMNGSYHRKTQYVNFCTLSAVENCSRLNREAH
jgi:hypothetical protein